MASRVLIVDDDPLQCRHIEGIVSSRGYGWESVSGGEAALARLGRTDAPALSAMILDLVMPDLDGMAVLERLGRLGIALPVIVQASPAGADAATSAMRAGAVDFLVKPASPERVHVSLANALKVGALQGELARLTRRRSGTFALSDIVSRTPIMQRALDLGERAARSAIPVLLEGEPGVGKENLARAIHGSSSRRGRPFMRVNCAAHSGTELEALLFGANPARTLRVRERASFSEAGGGTIFLQAIDALSAAAQACLARFLDRHERDANGKSAHPRGNARLIAATNRRLVDLVSGRSFRQDLFNRLNILPIWVPPLRDRRGDIPELARQLLARLPAAAGGTRITGIAAETMALLAAHHWPGNVRELEGAISRAMALADAGELAPQDFPQLLSGLDARASHIRRTDSPPAEAAPGKAERRGGGEQPPGFTAGGGGLSRYGLARLLDERGELRPIQTLEKEVIRFAVDHYGGQMSEVARRLGIGRSTLYRKMKDYGMAPGTSAP